MGNLRFRLSDMMPNAWFYKLKDMGSGATAGPRTTASHKRNNKKSQRNQPASPPPPPSNPSSKPPKQPHHQQYSYSRKSYYFTRDLHSTNDKNTLPNSPSKFSDHPSSPRKSSKQKAAKRRSATVAAARASSPKKLVSSSVSGGCGCRANWNKTDSLASATAVVAAGDRSAISLSDSGDSDSFPPEFRSDCSLTTESFDKMVSWSSNSCGCPLELADSGSNDIIIDIDKRSLPQPVHEAFDGLSDRDLPPILTKPSSFDDRIEDIKRKETSHEAKAAKKQGRTSPAKKVENSKPRASSLSVKVAREESLTVKRQQGRKQLNSANSPGIKLRVNSPRMGYRRNIQGQGRKSVSSSTTTTTTNSTTTSSRSSSSKKSLTGCLAVVKSSCDPHTDFRESMVEMIVENNLSASKDLEDLLACYLSLNADEYHDVIIQVFKQIWIDYLTTSRSK